MGIAADPLDELFFVRGNEVIGLFDCRMSFRSQLELMRTPVDGGALSRDEVQSLQFVQQRNQARAFDPQAARQGDLADPGVGGNNFQYRVPDDVKLQVRKSGIGVAKDPLLRTPDKVALIIVQLSVLD
jgi:hypothetical protein